MQQHTTRDHSSDPVISRVSYIEYIVLMIECETSRTEEFRFRPLSVFKTLFLSNKNRHSYNNVNYQRRK